MVDPYDENLKPITLPNGVVLRAPDDFETLRRNIYDTAKERTAAAFPMSYNGVRVELSDLDYADPDHVSVADQKKAMMEDKSITRRLRGKLRLVNEQDDSLLDERELTLMRVPHLTQRGTFINAGNEYTHSMQARLLHGAYSRRQNNGELETQFNVKPGTGRVFRVGFEPDTAQYRLRVGGSNLHLYSMLKDMGVPDAQLEKSWGPEVLALNRDNYDAKVFPKAYQNMVPAKLQVAGAPHPEKVEAMHAALNSSQLHYRAVKRTMPAMLGAKMASRWRAGIGIKMAALGQVAFTPDLTPDEAALQFLESVSPEIFYDLENVKSAAGFSPDLSKDDMQPAYDAIYAHAGPRLAGMKKWPEKWFPPGSDDLGWISWYMKYADGERGHDDTRQINRWKSFRQKNVSQFVKNPTARRAFALRYWAIDPLKLLDNEEQRREVRDAMNAYRKQELEKFHGKDKQQLAEALEKSV
jgi:hypothetical protein